MKKLLSLIVLAVSFSALANFNDISLGEPGYGGTGCPAGSASATLSPDKKSLSLIFDEFTVSAKKSMARKNCQISIPIHVPAGYSVSVINTDYRGYVYLPTKATARFTAEYFFAGMQGPKFMKEWLRPTDSDYILSTPINLEAVVWSPCGADVNMRVAANMQVRSTNTSEEAMATVDSADFTAGLLYTFQWKTCF
jgi:hypothetical protein